MFKYTLIALFALASATGPFNWERNFFVGMYTGFIGDPGQLYYNCLPDTQQYAIQEGFIKLAQDYQKDVALPVFFGDVAKLVEKFYGVYDVCKLYTYFDALAETILKTGPLFILKIFFNAEKIADDIAGFIGAMHTDPTTAGQFIGDMLK